MRVTACRSSGQSVKVWCAKNAISPQTYYRQEKRFCDALFSIENKLDNLTPGERMKKREELAKPMLMEFRQWLESIQPAPKSALAILRSISDIHGGDLVFDCPRKLVHLYTQYGSDSGAVFAYNKNMSQIRKVTNTGGLITRLYAVGAEGMLQSGSIATGWIGHVSEIQFTLDG